MSEVERSLIYCGKHKISCDHNNPEHQRRVFDPILLQRWKEHFASLFPTLESSKEVQKQVSISVGCSCIDHSINLIVITDVLVRNMMSIWAMLEC